MDKLKLMVSCFIKCFHTYWKIHGKWWRIGAPLVYLTLSRRYTRWVSNWMIRFWKFLLELRFRTLYVFHANFGTSSFFVLKRWWFIWLWHVFNQIENNTLFLDRSTPGCLLSTRLVSTWIYPPIYYNELVIPFRELVRSPIIHFLTHVCRRSSWCFNWQFVPCLVAKSLMTMSLSHVSKNCMISSMRELRPSLYLCRGCYRGRW